MIPQQRQGMSVFAESSAVTLGSRRLRDCPISRFRAVEVIFEVQNLDCELSHTRRYGEASKRILSSKKNENAKQMDFLNSL